MLNIGLEDNTRTRVMYFYEKRHAATRHPANSGVERGCGGRTAPGDTKTRGDTNTKKINVVV